MDNVRIVQIANSDLDKVQASFGQDSAKTLMKQPGLSQAELSDSVSWAAFHGNEPIAVATLSFNKERVGFLDFAVKSSERRQGVGKQLVQHVLQEPTVKSVHRLQVLVEMENTAAQKILSREGFSRIGQSSDGRLILEKH